jgi:hypothetical protein
MTGPLAGVSPSSIEHLSGVRHSSFFFPSGPSRLYASLYSPAASCRFTVVVCPTWGFENLRLLQWYHRLAHDLATSGIATLVPHWPGNEDSQGDPLAITLDRLVAAVADARGLLADWCGTERVGLVGVRVGAAVAALAAPMVRAQTLALAQPVFNIGAHFEQQEALWRRAQLGAEIPSEWAFGYPQPAGLRRPSDASRVLEALAAYPGKGAVIHYRRPTPEPVSRPLRSLTVWGSWRLPARVDHGPLRTTTERWLKRSIRDLR